MNNPGSGVLTSGLLASSLLMAATLTATTGATAGEQTLECKLYIAQSVDNASAYTAESSGAQFVASRRAGVCVFADGSVADKQFVESSTIREDGAAGDAVGISIYTFANGDTLTLRFAGAWGGGKGFEGAYEVMSGTGAYEGATGTGVITGTESPWKSTDVVDIKIDVTTTDS